MDDLNRLIQAARGAKMTVVAKERQRRSFAYGNTHIENGKITREIIDRAAEGLEANG